MHDWNDRMGGGGWWWMALVMAILLVGLIWLVVTLMRQSDRATAAPPAPSAHDILAERLARGEIDADEYHSRRDALSHHSPS